MGIQIEFLQAVNAAPKGAACSCACIPFLTSFSGSAMAFNAFHGGLDDLIYPLSDSVTITPISKSPSPSIADSCLPLLKSIHQTSPHSAMDRSQRSAGQETAASGLIFGVRFALSPPKKPGSSVIPKAKTLQALGEFRWMH